MLNALTIDVEDWWQLVHWKVTGEVVPPSPAVVKETEFILDRLAAYQVRATFFVLANVAETFPGLIRRIADAGHEVASHGLSHTRVYLQSPDTFREETKRAKRLLEEVAGQPVRGYRAAEFSVTHRSLWALDVLAEEDFLYDSSIFPIKGGRYGIPDVPLRPYRILTNQGSTLVEFPLTAIERWGRRWPIAGGGYFRLLPYRLTRAAIQAINNEGRPAVIYLHPYEFAPERLSVRISRPSLRSYLTYIRHAGVHNLARARVAARFVSLLREFEFAPLGELMGCV